MDATDMLHDHDHAADLRELRAEIELARGAFDARLTAHRSQIGEELGRQRDRVDAMLEPFGHLKAKTEGTCRDLDHLGKRVDTVYYWLWGIAMLVIANLLAMLKGA